MMMLLLRALGTWPARASTPRSKSLGDDMIVLLSVYFLAKYRDVAERIAEEQYPMWPRFVAYTHVHMKCCYTYISHNFPIYTVSCCAQQKHEIKQCLMPLKPGSYCTLL